MCSSWNQTDVSVTLSDAIQISFNGLETGVLTSSTTVRLERDVIEFGDFFQPVSQLFNHQCVTFGLVFRNIWMNVQLWPAQWKHFTCSVKLHCATT